MPPRGVKPRPYIRPKVRTRHVGQKFGRLTALYFIEIVDKLAKWRFRCDCGAEVERTMTSVKAAARGSVTGLNPSCGCARRDIKKRPYTMPSRRARNIARYAGERFGHLIALRFVEMVDGGHAKWLFRCDCGIEVEKLIANVLTSLRRYKVLPSCGCSSYVGPGFHGHAVGTGTPEYRAWLHMRERCLSPNDRFYADYGGRGIKVCERWLNDFLAFLEDMGPRPEGTTLDREDTNGDYTKENCRWATPKEQARNRRSTRWFTHEGQQYTLTDLTARASVSAATLRKRLADGWSIERALYAPTQQGRPLADGEPT